ncbi:mitochondrial carrier domain-containing protein, partial [Lactarius sanguifluus]
DHVFAGIGAGTVAVLCMNPLDLLNVKFQVSTRGPKGGIGRGIWRALCDIHAIEGWRGVYRGLSSNVAGNAGSWGYYFILFNQLERRTAVDAPDNLSVSQYRLFSAGASAVMAILTNPIWEVKVRTITAPPNSPAAYCGLRSAFLCHSVLGFIFAEWCLGQAGSVLQFMAYKQSKS